jgi:ABC-2 type transport system ATP-binding protein
LTELPGQRGTPSDPTDDVPALELEGLTKYFGDFVAVEDLNFVVRRGDVYGFLGPNGSGKSTTIRMILGLVRPTSGEARIFGRPATGPQERAKMAGFVEAPGFYEYLSARDNLRLLAAADRRGDKAPPLQQVLETVGLSDRARDRVRTYSQGMKQRLAIAAALLREPEFLVLDEPTNGLDPGGMRDIRALVRQLSGDGLTIFLSTHLLAEVEQLCNRVAVVGRGRLLAEGALAEIAEQARGRTEYRLVADDPEATRRVLQTREDVAVLNGRPEELEGFRPDEVVRFAAGHGGVGPVVRSLVEEGVEVLALVPTRPSLEELFLRLTEDES